MSLIKSLGLILLCVSISSCSTIGKTWKSLVGGGDSKDKPAAQSADGQPKAAASFSQQPNLMTGKDRQYKRVTKDNFSDEQLMEESSGSLWKKEGQGSYLFSQNNLRVFGDILNVEIQGKTAENLTAKLKLLKQAWAKLDAPPKIQRTVASDGRPKPKRPAPESENPTAAGADSNQMGEGPPAAPVAVKDGESGKPEEKAENFDLVPCRITEKNADGSYRIKGVQAVFVGRREYKILITGIVRPDDVSSDKIASTQILDGKFDLIAGNKDGR
ncbi:MAG: flagellar basal body L-ring protein FlgH [Oligoflexia bacterium]|nr:flagellar basal body L-ring protein FlgH [Oligoflexia bacterium]